MDITTAFNFILNWDCSSVKELYRALRLVQKSGQTDLIEYLPKILEGYSVDIPEELRESIVFNLIAVDHEGYALIGGLKSLRVVPLTEEAFKSFRSK